VTSSLALYKLLVKLGASEPDAEAAATLDVAALATKEDLLRLEVTLHRELSAQTRWVIGAMVGLTGIFAAIVKLL
jgi:hypothetical protein